MDPCLLWSRRQPGVPRLQLYSVYLGKPAHSRMEIQHCNVVNDGLSLWICEVDSSLQTCQKPRRHRRTMSWSVVTSASFASEATSMRIVSKIRNVPPPKTRPIIFWRRHTGVETVIAWVTVPKPFRKRFAQAESPRLGPSLRERHLQGIRLLKRPMHTWTCAWRSWSSTDSSWWNSCKLNVRTCNRWCSKRAKLSMAPILVSRLNLVRSNNVRCNYGTPWYAMIPWVHSPYDLPYLRYWQSGDPSHGWSGDCSVWSPGGPANPGDQAGQQESCFPWFSTTCQVCQGKMVDGYRMVWVMGFFFRYRADSTIYVFCVCTFSEFHLKWLSHIQNILICVLQSLALFKQLSQHTLPAARWSILVKLALRQLLPILGSTMQQRWSTYLMLKAMGIPNLKQKQRKHMSMRTHLQQLLPCVA